MRLALTVPFALLAVAACGVDAEPVPLVAPLGPVPLVDIDPDPDAIEVTIIAGPAQWSFLPDKPADVWAYRDGNADGAAGRVPGPMLLGKVGDRVVVNFRNELPEATTVHWHGLRVHAGHDGSNVSQMGIEPGETFKYEFTLTDAGTFWFHPHLAADEQIERGLYAPIVVLGGEAVPVDTDRMFVLDDVKVESTGKLSETITALDLMVGRQGNVLLVNGEKLPRIDAPAGARERWRLLNTANGTFFNVTLPGHKLRVIAWDGGLLPEPYEVDDLVIAPGERYEVLVELGGAEGDELELQTLHYDRGHDLPDLGARTIATIALKAPPTNPAPALPERWGKAAALPITAETPRRAFLLTEEEAEGPDDEPRFFINDRAYPDVEPLMVGADALEVWEITNDATMDHPFHLHGTFFQVLDQPHLGWKDTVNVPQKSTVRFAVAFDNPGLWMYHCHILEHTERGMMGVLQVGDSP
ncbi:MAG TPA: multicopper oxidase family protein [Nannocystis sp.]|jgi:FtsP/CotA-like multicopper oxidase with cupredoxin domain